MKKLTTKIQLILFTALLAGFTSCSDDDDAGMITEESETIADFVASEEEYSSLAEALDRTGLTATLDAEGTYTVFAPNNAAFEAYLGGTAVADVPVEDLTQILLNHVLAVEARASSLTTGYVNNLATYADTDANLSMYINVDSDVVTINGGSELIGGANVTATDFEFSNGIVHTVDAVIALPTVATFAVADPTFTQLETALTAKQVSELADVSYSINDIGAAIASGSFKTAGMIIAPCSIKTLSEVANGVTSNLLSRAADVVLKERRRLVLMVRESPFHHGHLQSMLRVTEMGGIVAPPVPAFYNNPKTIKDIIDHTIGRTLDLLGLEVSFVKRWSNEIIPQTDTQENKLE